MSTVAFTAETRPAILPVVQRMAKHFTVLNGIPCHVITADSFDFKKLQHLFFIKWFLWDFVGKEVDTVIWKDSDTVDLLPLGRLPDQPFCAVKDWKETLIDHEAELSRWGILDNYFNTGFFIAKRETQPMFEELKALALARTLSPYEGFHTYPDQNILNIKIRELYGKIELLPSRYNHFVAREAATSDTIMLHYAGGHEQRRFLAIRSQLKWLETRKCLVRHKHKNIRVPIAGAFNGSSILTPHGRLLLYRTDHAVFSSFLDHNFDIIERTTYDLGLNCNNDPRLCWHDGNLFVSTSYFYEQSWERVELRKIKIEDPYKPLRLIDAGKFDSFECGYVKKWREKNWQPFSTGETFFYEYSFKPHRIAKVDLERDRIEIAHSTEFKEEVWNGKFGKTFHLNIPPIRLNNLWLSGFHAKEHNSYAFGFCLFEDTPPYRIIKISHEPFLVKEDAIGEPVTRGIQLYFPMQAELIPDGKILIFGGCNDNSVIVHTFSTDEILKGMVSITTV